MDDLRPDETSGGDFDQEVVDDLQSTMTSDEPGTGDNEPQADEPDVREQELYELRRMNQQSQQRLALLEDFLVRATQQPKETQQRAQAEDIDLDDPAAVYKIAERLVDERLSEKEQRDNARYRQIQEREFAQVVKEVNAEAPDIIKRFQPEIDEYYRNNPEQRLNPESYRTVVTYLKGKVFDEREAESRRKRLTTSPTPVPPRGPGQPKPEKFEYTPEQERLARIYGMLEGKDIIEPDEWNSVSQDRLRYPGRRGGRR